MFDRLQSWGHRSSHALRRGLFTLLLVMGVSLSGAVLAGWVQLTSAQTTLAQRHALITSTLATVTTATGISLAPIFLTAQVSRGKLRVASTEALYRSAEAPTQVGVVVLTIVLGHGVLARLDLRLDASLVWVDLVVILGSCAVFLIIPNLLLQVENLRIPTVATKLAMQVRPAQVEAYGLTEVSSRLGCKGEFDYELALYGLRPAEVDPLRPLHEILMIAVDDRDRVLFGKLVRSLLLPIARVHGVYWDATGQTHALDRTPPRRPPFWARLAARRVSRSSRLHVTLMLLHYAVKRARNQLAEWDGRDTARHGIVLGLSDLLRALSTARNTGQAIDIALFALLHVSAFYSRIEPHGRIEPLNSMYETANQLWQRGYFKQAELAGALLGYCAARTKQLSPDRSPSLESLLFEPLREIFLASRVRHQKGDEELPGDPQSDPWRGIFPITTP